MNATKLTAGALVVAPAIDAALTITPQENLVSFLGWVD